jgi:hypothetical protein
LLHREKEERQIKKKRERERKSDEERECECERGAFKLQKNEIAISDLRFRLWLYFS